MNYGYFLIICFFSVLSAQNDTIATLKTKINELKNLACESGNELTKSTMSSKIIFDKYEEVKKDLQVIIEEIDPRERAKSILTKRMQEANLLVQQRIAQKPSHTDPVVSFIIPCYNRASTLRDVIDSIYTQNLTMPFEVIAVDDASIDDSFTILQQYEAKYPNFFAYKHAINKKAPATRNTAIVYARGEYIFNADSDDVFLPNTLEKMIRFTIDKSIDACFFEELRYFNDYNKSIIVSIAQSKPPTGFIDLSHYLVAGKDYIAFHAGNRMFKKAAWFNVGGYVEGLGHDSWSFSFRLLAHGYRTYVYPGSAYLHRHWLNHTGMFLTDRKNGVNDISPKMVIHENSDLLTEDSMTFLKKTHIPDGLLTAYFTSGRNVKLINSQLLQNILNGYAAEDNHDFINACKFFQEAIKFGLCKKNIVLRSARAALYTMNFDLVLAMLEKL